MTDYWVTIERRVQGWVPRARGHGSTKQAAWEDALAVWNVTWTENDDGSIEPQQDADEEEKGPR